MCFSRSAIRASQPLCSICFGIRSLTQLDKTLSAFLTRGVRVRCAPLDFSIRHPQDKGTINNDTLSPTGIILFMKDDTLTKYTD